jgi:hypothetical protein
MRRKIKHWMDNQHLTKWRVLSSTKRQAQELISGPSPTAKTRLLSFNKKQSTFITDLLTRHNILRRHLHLMELIVPCVGGMEQRMKPQPTFSGSMKLWLHSDMYIWDIKSFKSGKHLEL